MAESVSSSGRQSPIIQFKLCSTNENALPSLSNTLRVRQTTDISVCIVALYSILLFSIFKRDSLRIKYFEILIFL